MMMRHLYNFILILLLPFILLRLLWRSRKNPAYAKRWAERFGYFPKQLSHKGPTIWIHAVSVGETIAAVPLVAMLKKQHPKHRIVFTTTTPTGSERVQKLLGDQVSHVYTPYDYPGAVKRFLTRTQPCLLILMETELWPNIMHYCTKRAIPVLLLNARLCERSARRYQQWPSVTTPMINGLTRIAAQSQADADRFARLGMDKAKIQITGSIKFDITLPGDLADQAAALRALCGQDRPIWVGASTHRGEEDLLLTAFERVKAALPNALLILVPRHPERFDDVAALCQSKGFHTVRRSDHQPCQSETDIFVGDSMGELMRFYAASDVAFVGGSLTPIGGHNVIEPAVLGIPSIVGPYTEHFAAITQLMLEAGTTERIQNASELANCLIMLLQDKALSKHKGEIGKAVVRKNAGALQRQLDCVEACLTH